MKPALCGPEEVDELIDFIASTWGPNHALARSRALLTWQFDGARLKGARPSDLAVLLLRDEARRIVAMQGLIGARVMRSEESFDGAWLCNLMAAEGARAAGAGMTMLKAVTDLGLDVLMTAGINPALYRVYPAMGFMVRPEMDRWAWLSRSRANSPIISAFVGADDRERPARPADYCEDIDGPFGEPWDRLWSTRPSDYFGIHRDTGYLNWRYRNHPIFDYRALVVREGEKWRGLAIYRMEDILPEGGSALRVVELHGDERAMVSLLRVFAQKVEDEGHLLVDFGAEIFARAGWRRATSDHLPPPNLFQPLAPAYRPLNSAYKTLTTRLPKSAFADFTAVRADSDQDRPNAIG